MTICKAGRRGKPRLFIDIHYRKPDGTQGRYRKDAQVQTLAAARTEERRLLALIAQHSEPIEPRPEVPSAPASSAAPSPSPASLFSAAPALTSPTPAQPFPAQPPPPPPLTFADAVALFCAGKAITRLKPSTRRSYDEVLSTRLLPRFGERPIDALTFADVTRLDAELVRGRASPSRRGNVQIVLRSVLRAAPDAGKLAAMPRLPALPKKGHKVLIPLSAEQVDQILAVSSPSQRLAFALAAFAGLRAGEVRALRWTDVRLDDGQNGVLVDRFAQTKSETSTTKSGHEREGPLAPQLAARLQATPPDRRHGLVATTERGGPWGDYGLNQALKRAIRRAGCKGSSRYHDLRHFFVAQLFQRGGSAPAVQALAGHLHLTTIHLCAPGAHADLQDTLTFFLPLPPDRARGALLPPPVPGRQARSNHLKRVRSERPQGREGRKDQRRILFPLRPLRPCGPSLRLLLSPLVARVPRSLRIPSRPPPLPPHVSHRPPTVPA